MVNHLAVSVELCKRLMESGDCGDLAREVSVEEVAVTGPAQQPSSGSWVVESAESFNDIDTSPAGDSLGEPEQGFDSSFLSLEGVRRQRPEAVGEQSNGLNQWDVVSCSHNGEQGKPDGD
ncbi:hypothetical protein [Streptomyces dubilierae]|uniref:Uncharacterized protein n=1 Tax=Streptomyces dubilierae TaxID=3075533 RepID=A0ABU2P1P5_9ACTN|nr:hypothetical protein [Streptomyces sp. DSM 41921]MDT0386057.1 hypothetical protein [Streptomyces sp. DSM 41921]